MACGLVSTSAEDWPQWGGNDPGRNMYSRAKGLPDKFDAGKLKAGTEEVDLKTTKNVKFALKLGSQSYGNPVVAGGKIFVGTNNETPRDPKHVGDRSILMCFDEKTGALLWQLVVPKLKSGKVNDWENLGLLAAATVEGDRLWIVTSRCEVLCLDVNGMTTGPFVPFAPSWMCAAVAMIPVVAMLPLMDPSGRTSKAPVASAEVVTGGTSSAPVSVSVAVALGGTETGAPLDDGRIGVVQAASSTSSTVDSPAVRRWCIDDCNGKPLAA